MFSVGRTRKRFSIFNGQNTMRFIIRALNGLLLVAVTLGLIGFGVFELQTRLNKPERKFQPPTREQVHSVEVQNLAPQDIRPVITTYGEIQSRRSLVLRAPASGEVVEMADELRDGQSVLSGQQLLIVDPGSQQSRYSDARAALAEAEAELSEARNTLVLGEQELAAAQRQVNLQSKELQRQRTLKKNGLATESNVSSAELALTNAEQTLLNRNQSLVTASKRVERADLKIERARIDLADAERDLGDTRLTAPFAGILDAVNLELGQRVNQNEVIGNLIDPAALEAVFRVPNYQFAALLDSEGQLLRQPVKVVLKLGELELTTNGTIDRIAAVIGKGQSGRLVYATLQIDQNSILRPDDFVRVEIEEPALSQVATIPATAATADGRVLIVNSDQRLEERQLNVLRRLDDELVVSSNRLDLQVVTQRQPQLGSGVKVKILNPVASASAPANQETVPELVALEDDRRAVLIEFIAANQGMPKDRKERILAALNKPKVPLRMVERIESRMGG